MNDINNNQIILEGYVYDLKEFSKVHPGGNIILNIFGGNDVSVHYYMFHNHQFVYKKALEPYKIRKIDNYVNKINSIYDINSKQYRSLKNIIKKKLKNPYATLEWYIKAVTIMLIEFYIEYDNIFYGFNIAKSVFHGIIMAMIGLCIQHDANHSAVSKTPWVNFAWGLTQDWIGGSSLLWKHHHNLLHHAYTNLESVDPDTTGSLIRFHKMTKWESYHKLQAIYTWLLLPLLPLSWHFKEIYDMIYMHHSGYKISSMARNEAYLGIILRVIFITRFYIIPLYYHNNINTILCMFISLAVGGFYLGINFIISHNFEDVSYTFDKKKDWAFEQVETSSTVGGRVLGFFHGGLNYQIEHHLFPRISHVHYHKIHKIVKKWCEENNIRYTYYNNIIDNVISCYKQIKKMGNNL
jgi:fatty acid desaturase (delta-4 desaturase)